MTTENEDKIKVLEKALRIMEIEISLAFGVCDALMMAARKLGYPDIFREPKFYGIKLPPRDYAMKEDHPNLFSFPCDLEGRQQRIEVLQNAIKKLKQ